MVKREEKAPGKGRAIDRLRDGYWRWEWLRFLTIVG